MLMRSDPLREFDRLAQQTTSDGRLAAMPMDAYRHDDRFLIHVDVPGVDPSSIDLTVEKNVLTVSAERRWEPAEGDQVLVSERPRGRFSRQLFLGKGLDVERIEASYDHGVLSVSIPVAEQVKPRRVEISARNGKARALEV
jgi:HSP20 family protein